MLRCIDFPAVARHLSVARDFQKSSVNMRRASVLAQLCSKAGEWKLTAAFHKTVPHYSMARTDMVFDAVGDKLQSSKRVFARCN